MGAEEDVNLQNGTITELRPCRYLSPDADSPDIKNTALIILNCPIQDIGLVKTLYQHAAYRICCDGGANRLHNLISQEKNSDALFQELLPSAIHGDLDSLKEDVRNNYKKLGVPVTRDPDKYSTDFGKCINHVVEAIPEIRNVLVLGSIGGRVDHGMGILHEFYREQKFRRPFLRMFFFSEASVSMLAMTGTTKIHTPLSSGLITENAGILSLYGKAHITIKGFEWDVEDWPTEMGGNMSTSNHIKADEVTITTDVDVLFTIERRLER